MENRKACLYIANNPVGLQNKVFEDTAIGDGMKNLSYPFVGLKKEFLKYNIDISTKDINRPEDSEIIILVNDPHLFLHIPKNEGQIFCLMIYESPVYIPESWDRKYHDRFDYVYTFDETLVDNQKYFYYPFAIDTEYFSKPECVSEEMYKKRTLASFVSNSIHKVKDPINPGSLIHRRYETLAWFGKNHPNDFGFYGGTFLKRDFYFAFKGVGVLKKIFPQAVFRYLAAQMQKNLIKIFKGELKTLEKFEVIKKYNFYYCFENVAGVNGYVTEKIFDCLYSSIVPIYWGAPNIHDIIPYKCFIDGNRFSDFASLYSYIKNMSYPEYAGYLNNARIYLESKDLSRVSVSNFSKCILGPLQHALTKPRNLIANN